MLGRTRPSSRILLWPRSQTSAVRFATTASTGSNDEGAAEYEPAAASDHVSLPTPRRRTFIGIRKMVLPPVMEKYTIRRMQANTEPIVPHNPWANLEKAPGPTGNGTGPTEMRPVPPRRVAAEGDPNRSKQHSSPPQRANVLLGNWGRGAGIETTVAPAGQWKAFSPNPGLVARKQPFPAGTPSISSAQKRQPKEVEPDDGTPPRSKLLEEMKAWDFESPPASTAQQQQQREAPSEEADGPLRSKLIEQMVAWERMREATEADGGEKQAAVPQPGPPARKKKASEELPPLDDHFRNWLERATQDAVDKAEARRHLTNGVAVYDGPAVLVLNRASRSLLESDFYRLAPQGKHLGDWAAGIARIVQARAPATYEPLGKYYIFFHTRAAAMAYSEEAVRLHDRARRDSKLIFWAPSISPSSSSSSSFPSSSTDMNIPRLLPLTPTLASESPDLVLDPALRGYTLVPHSSRLDLKLHLCKDLVHLRATRDKLGQMNRYLSSPPGTDESDAIAVEDLHHFVLVALEGCKTTPAALHGAIARDGEERRQPWALPTRRDGKSPIAAVVPRRKPRAGAETDNSSAEDKQLQMGDKPRFWRFIVPFTEAAEARRFVRSWHRREMPDLEGRNMWVIFNVTALW